LRGPTFKGREGKGGKRRDWEWMGKPVIKEREEEREERKKEREWRVGEEVCSRNFQLFYGLLRHIIV